MVFMENGMSLTTVVNLSLANSCPTFPQQQATSLRYCTDCWAGSIYQVGSWSLGAGVVVVARKEDLPVVEKDRVTEYWDELEIHKSTGPE